MSMNTRINELNENYKCIIENGPKSITAINKVIELINKYGHDNIIKHIEEDIISAITKIHRNVNDISYLSYKTIKEAKDLFENIKTNDEKVLCVLNSINKLFNSNEDTYLRISKASKSMNNALYEYHTYSYNNKKQFIEIFEKTIGKSLIAYINTYINALKTIVNAYNKCINYISSNKSVQNKQINKWQIINKHGFSVNKMYTGVSDRIIRSTEYNAWIKDMLNIMKATNMQSLRSMGVNPNKPMKLEVEFKLVKGSDTDNPLKSFIDLLVRYYNLSDDNNFVNINVSRNPEWAKSYSDGQIKFKIQNI